MFTVHSGSGAQDYNVGEPTFSREQWEAMRNGAIQLLRSRGSETAATILESLPFQILDGTNFFGDEFVVLYAELQIQQYADIVATYSDPHNRQDFQQIAYAVDEICPVYVRFVGFGAVLENANQVVEAPQLQFTSTTVEEALADARQLISSRGSTSGIDRAHTAFHGYLRVICDQANISVADDANVTRLFRELRDHHPSLQAAGARSEEITQILRALSSVISTLNPLRNRASLAHPNADLLERAEADLVLNSIHTLLHFLNSKIG